MKSSKVLYPPFLIIAYHKVTESGNQKISKCGEIVSGTEHSLFPKKKVKLHLHGTEHKHTVKNTLFFYIRTSKFWVEAGCS